MSLDLIFCSKLVETSTFEAVADLRMEQYLLDQGLEVFKYVRNFQREFGEMPKPLTVLRGTGVELPDAAEAPEPLNYYIEELKRRFVANRVGGAITQAMKKLEGAEPYEAADIIQREASRLYLEIGQAESGLVDLVKLGPILKKEYLRAKAAKGIDGIRSPWPALDEFTMGWHPEELVVIVGRPQLGKTWALVKVGETAWLQKEKPLFVAKEMSASRIGRRFVSIAGKFPFSEVRKGQLGEFVEGAYLSYLDELGEQNPFYLVSGSRVRDVSDLDIVISELRPTIVLIDGLYLLKPLDWRGGARWERVTAVVEELHDSAQRWKLPFIATTQFSRTAARKKKKDKGTLEDIGFSDAIGQFADLVLSLNRDADLEVAKKMLWKCLKGREHEKIDFVTWWDLDTMNFEVSAEDGDGSGSAEGQDDSTEEPDGQDGDY